MNRMKVMFAAVGVISLTLSATPLPASAQEHKAEQHGTDPMTAKLMDKKGEEFEKQFLQLMIEHHKSGVDMARMVPKKAKHTELKQFAEKIVSDQSREIDQMKEWLKNWHKAEPNPAVEPKASEEKMKKEMAHLEKADGAEFDRLFLDHMTMHHMGAVRMSELVNEKTDRKELRELAAKIASEQKKEIEQMQSWKKEWFKKE